MKTVKIAHPEAGESQVPESAVAAWRSSGWEVVEEPPVDKAPAKKSGSKEQTPRGRRATNGDED